MATESLSSNIYLMEHMYVLLPLKDVISKTSIELGFFFSVRPFFGGAFKKNESQRSHAFCLTSIISNKTNSAR